MSTLQPIHFFLPDPESPNLRVTISDGNTAKTITGSLAKEFARKMMAMDNDQPSVTPSPATRAYNHNRAAFRRTVIAIGVALAAAFAASSFASGIDGVPSSSTINTAPAPSPIK